MSCVGQGKPTCTAMSYFIRRRRDGSLVISSAGVILDATGAAAIVLEGVYVLRFKLLFFSRGLGRVCAMVVLLFGQQR